MKIRLLLACFCPWCSYFNLLFFFGLHLLCPFFVLFFLLGNKLQSLPGTLLPSSLCSTATNPARPWNTQGEFWGFGENFIPLEFQICCFRLPAEKAEVSIDFCNIIRKRTCRCKRDCFKQILQLQQRSYICIAKSTMWQTSPLEWLKLKPLLAPQLGWSALFLQPWGFKGLSLSHF